MKKTISRFVMLSLLVFVLAACSTVKGTMMGAGIGYVLGDAEMGASIGATAGLIKDIWD